MKGFEEAKRRSLERAADGNAPKYPIPWSFANAQRAQAVFGADFWPYGIEANRVTLDSFLRQAHEQGACARRMTAEELFPIELAAAFRI
jgi:4,5-dihydroxyphthalate decarboxylase